MGNLEPLELWQEGVRCHVRQYGVQEIPGMIHQRGTCLGYDAMSGEACEDCSQIL